MTTVTKSEIESALQEIQDPHSETSLVNDRKIKDILVNDQQVKVTLELGYPAKSSIPDLRAQIESRLGGMDGVSEIESICQ